MGAVGRPVGRGRRHLLLLPVVPRHHVKADGGPLAALVGPDAGGAIFAAGNESAK